MVYASFCRPDRDVTDYRTQITGIAEADLIDAPSVRVVREEVRQILDKEEVVIVGHGLDHDLAALELTHVPPPERLRDLALYPRLMSLDAEQRLWPASLPDLAFEHLDITTEDWRGMFVLHDPVADAWCAMKVFLEYGEEWEARLRGGATHSPTDLTPLQA
ncbi:unnamed protein product [Pedinophyceae sp. YPF-701]|nr:unnamed protein product [Pedinophyceae sp. YPF-701]